MKKSFCEYCGFENPSDWTVCQKCEKKLRIQGEKVPRLTVDFFSEESMDKFELEDCSAILSYSKFISWMGFMILIVGIILFMAVWADLSFWMALGYLVGTILIAYPLIIVPTIVKYFLDLRRDLNRASHSNYVTTKMLQELLDTLQAIQEQNTTKEDSRNHHQD